MKPKDRERAGEPSSFAKHIVSTMAEERPVENMRTICSLCIVALVILSGLLAPTAQEQETIAVLGISGTDESKIPVVQDIMVRALARPGKIAVIAPFFVERAMSRYNATLKSIWEADDACRIGGHLRAQKVVCLRYIFSKKDVMVKTVVYHTETRAVVFTDAVSGDAREFSRLVFLLASRIYRKLWSQWIQSDGLPPVGQDVSGESSRGVWLDLPDLLTSTDRNISIVLKNDAGDGAVVKQGERLKFHFWVESKQFNEKPCYLTILDVSPSGRVSMLYPNVSSRESRIIIGRGYAFPSSAASFDFAAGCEPGEELVVAIASRGGLQFINRYLSSARRELLPLIEPSFSGLVKDRILPESAKSQTGIAVAAARYIVDF